MYSLIIRGARVIDGSGCPWYRGDLGVQGDTIVAIGDLEDCQADTVIDGSGMVVAPGFIDIHTHSDTPLMVQGFGQAHIRQGVTTGVLGNCGSSSAPMNDEMQIDLERMRAGRYQGEPWDWHTMGEYLDRLTKQGVSQNVAALVGHSAIRNSVMGFDDSKPTPEQMEAMKALVRESMEGGAIGISTGLVYTPSCYADTDEIVELTKVVAEYGGLYASHIRGENDTVLEAVAEAIEVGRRAGVPVQIAHLKAMGTHMWGKSVEILQMIDQARAEGIDVTFDQYPYTASATGLGAVLPPWAHVGGKAALVKRLQDPAAREKMKHEILTGTDEWVSMYKGVGWENVLVTHFIPDASIEGKSVAEIAELRGTDGFTACFDLLLEAKGDRVSIVYFTIGDEDLERIMRHPAMMVGSDSGASAAEGILAQGKPHPRTFGTFVRVLGHYARDKKTITLEEAVRKMTSAPAARLGLHDRGLIKVGMKADLVVFDPDNVKDQATYANPLQYPVGIKTVVVNGRVTVQDGEHTGALAGTVLRRK